ncbi:MAG: hypothetical protein ACI9VR_004063 [Cognaticolwellia sp.]|jgi:hypothetical protein
MNKNLIYVGGAVLGIGAAVLVFSVLGDDSDTPVIEPVQLNGATGQVVQKGIAESTPSTPRSEVRTPKSGTEERKALLKRPVADFALRSEVTLKVLAAEVRAAGDEALADEMMTHVIEARKERYDEDLDGEAFIAEVSGYSERAGNTPGLSSKGHEAQDLLNELIVEYR